MSRNRHARRRKIEKKHDETVGYNILKELKIEDIEITNVIRVVNKGGRYPRRKKR